MSLAWPKTIDVHLGRGYCMLRVHKQPVQVRQYPGTLPLSRAFASLSDTLQELRQNNLGANRPRWLQDRLRVSLSAAICPPVAHPVPSGIESQAELQAVACASAARQLDCNADTLVCALQPLAPGLAAALPRDVLEQFKLWARVHRLNLVSLQPLWSIVTACRSAHRKDCTGIELHEPDAHTIISQNAAAPRYSAQSTDATESWASSDGLDAVPPGVLRLALTLEPQTLWADMPDYWPLHWKRP